MSPLRIAGLLLALIGLVALVAPHPVQACPFCSAQGQTLSKEVNQASFVVFGTLSNPKLSNNPNDLAGGTTDLTIEEVIKSHDFVKSKKQIVLPRYVPVDRERETKFLVFCDLFRDKIDPYLGMPAKDKELATYLKGAVALPDKDIPKRLAFFFKYLDHADAEISTDAYKEFAFADYKDVITMMEAGELEAYRAKLVKWLRSPETPSYRYGLYGYLLGRCGKPEDAELYLDLLNQKRGLLSGVDGILAGYITLKPKDGWAYTRALLTNAEGDFSRRYAALRTLRFLWDYRRDLVAPKDVSAAVQILLDQGDIADLAVEDLRKWKQWDCAEKILGLHNKPTHNTPIVQRAILRFALACPPEIKRASDFVAAQRKADPERVKDAEELLRLEVPAKPADGK